MPLWHFCNKDNLSAFVCTAFQICTILYNQISWAVPTLNFFLCNWSQTVIQAGVIKKGGFLTFKTLYHIKCASLTRLLLLVCFFVILSSLKLFFTDSLLATGSFICQNWINIVDGTNIVNLPEEWSWLNSISADNTRGKALRDTATLLKVFCFGEVIGLDKRVMQSLPSLKPKCRSNVGVEFFCNCSAFLLSLIQLIFRALLKTNH